MENLKSKIINCPINTWCYYKNPSESLRNPFARDDNNGHFKFIKQYFKHGEKDEIFNHLGISKIPRHRYIHTNSIFFLGIIIANESNLKKLCEASLNSPGRNDFTFLWYLTCLFHDFGYEYESNGVSDNLKDLNHLRSTLDIDYDLLAQDIENIPNSLIRNIEKYYQLRVEKHKKPDHGIIAGLYLFDKLVKIRSKRARIKNKRLIWDQILVEYYALAAAAIATHNIWFCENNLIREAEYRKYHLDDIISHRPISRNEAPLLFLLGLVDTIDPLKINEYTKHNQPLDILGSLNMQVNKNYIKLEKNSSSRLNFSKIRKKVNDLKGWLNVSLKNLTQNSIEIEFIDNA